MLLAFWTYGLMTRLILVCTAVTEVVSFSIVPELPDSLHVELWVVLLEVRFGWLTFVKGQVLLLFCLASFQYSLLNLGNSYCPCLWNMGLYHSFNVFLKACNISFCKKNMSS
jgi:hypothetical protein